VKENKHYPEEMSS